MEDTRPYWKVIVSLSFSLAATILFVVLGVKLLMFFTPFVIGWLISAIANPVVCWLEKRLKIVKKLGSAIIIVAVLAAIICGIYFGVSKLAEEVGSLLANFPQMYAELEAELQEIGNDLQGFFRLLPSGIQEGWHAMVSDLDNTMGTLIEKMSEPTVAAAGNLAKGIPSVLVSTIVTIVAAYFFIAERENVILWFKRITPKPIQDRMSMVIDNLKHAVGGYFKAQFKIMLVVGALLFVGFYLLGVDYAVLLAIVIAILDFLPFFGTGTALWPWAAYKVLSRDYKMAIMLMILYGVTQLVRQVLQPKLVGDGVGLKPLPTLVLLYAGYKAGGLIAMILAVPAGMIVINMYKAGAFDYILDDVRILVRGVQSLREKDT